MTHTDIKTSSLKFTLLFMGVGGLLIALFALYAGRSAQGGAALTSSLGETVKIIAVFAVALGVAAQGAWRLVMVKTQSVARGSYAGLLAVLFSYLLLGIYFTVTAAGGQYGQTAAIFFGVVMTITAPFTFPIGYFIGRYSAKS